MPGQARSGHAVRVALDTNILAYAEGVNGASRKKIALEMIGKLPTEATLLPVQTLGELFHVLVRKAGKVAGTGEDCHPELAGYVSVNRDVAGSPARRAGVGSEASFRNLGRDNRRRSGGRGLPVASLRRHAVRLYVERRHRDQSVFAHPSRTTGDMAGRLNRPAPAS